MRYHSHQLGTAALIDQLSEQEFAHILHRHVSPTSPIESEEHLFGRTRQLELVQQALYAPGRSIFIYGDRGVGKTSLAHTVAFSHQSATHNPVLLACEPQTTFAGLMNSALAYLRAPNDKSPSTTSLTFKAGIKGMDFEASGARHIPESQPSAIADLNQLITELLAIAANRRDESVVIVIDEFDRITSDEERGHFADFIKQVGDQKLPFRFIFCGVAESLQKLLGTHSSCYRYLEGIELKTLTYDARYEIIDNIAAAFNCEVHDPHRHRIAAISDGFPHYIHRMCEQLFWQMFRDPHPRVIPTAAHYREAVVQSVLGIEQHLRQSYEQAIMKNAPGYEQVLWAIADHTDVIRNTESIYGSYQYVMAASAGDEVLLDRQTVVTRLNALKLKGSGLILTSHRRGWYQFRESIMRGYVRLRAEEQGCELALDYAAASSVDPSLKWRPRTPHTKYSTKPKNIRKTEYLH